MNNPVVNINPVKRELLNNALVTIADNVMVMIVRTARSSNVKNSLDFSAAILDGDGQLVAQGLAVPLLQLGLPDSFVDHGDSAQLLASIGLDGAGIAAAIRRRLGST